MKKLGFFGGCYNPPTIAHIELASKIADKYNLDEIYFVPMNDFYQKDYLVSLSHRIKMLEICLKDYKKLKISKIEQEFNRKTSIEEIFSEIYNKYKDSEVYYIMGIDNIEKLLNNCSEFAKYKYIFLNRFEKEKDDILQRKLDAKLEKSQYYLTNIKGYENISSSDIREKIKNGEKVNNINKDVYKYILENNLYKD